MWDWDSKGPVHSVALGQNGTGPQREWYTVRLGLNGTGTQCGTGKEWDRNLEGMVHSGTRTHWDYYTAWDWDRMGQGLRGNGT